MITVDNNDLRKKLWLNNKFHNNEVGGIILNSLELQEKHIYSFYFNNDHLDSFFLIDNFFEKCIADRCTFYGCALNGSILRDCVFRNCLFRKAELQKVELINCCFDNCDFSRAQLLDSKIENSKFIACNFSGLQIYDCDLLDTTLNYWPPEILYANNNLEYNVVKK